MMNTDLEDKWWCKIRKVQNKQSSATQERYCLELLSLAKQAQPISFQTMYLMFFRSFKNQTGLSIFFSYFLKSILAHSVAIYKWKWHKKEQFIDNLICLLDPFPPNLVRPAKKCLQDFLLRQEETLRRLFLVKMQSQRFKQLKELMDYQLLFIIDFDCEQMVQLQEDALPITFQKLLKENGDSSIKDHVLTTIRKLQHLIKTFPDRRYINYFNFLKSHTKYYQIQPHFQLKQTQKYIHIDKFQFIRSKELLPFDKVTLYNDTSRQRLLKFTKLVEAAQQYYESTNKYYPKIDENCVFWNQKEEKWKFEIEKPFLNSMGLLVEPLPMTNEMQLISITPDGNQPLTTFWEQKYYWFFIKECLVDNNQQEQERLTVLEANHVFRLLLLGYHLLTKKKFPIYLPHLQQSQNMAFLAEGIQSDPQWLCAFLPGYTPPQSFSLKLNQLVQWNKQLLCMNDSEIQSRGFLQLKRVSTVRLMLLKRIIALLAHKKYFGRLLNAKKYLIIFHLTAIQLMFLLQNITIGQARRPYIVFSLREELIRSFEAINKENLQQNYQAMAYSKLQTYKRRSDEQSSFLRKESNLAENAEKVNSSTIQMRQINQKLQKLEKQMSEGFTGYTPRAIRLKYNYYLQEMAKLLIKNLKISLVDLTNLNQTAIIDYVEKEKGKSLHKGEDQEKRDLGKVVTSKLALMIEICLKLDIFNLARLEAQILPMVIPGEAGQIPQQKMDKSNLQKTLYQLKVSQKMLSQMNYCSSYYQTNTFIVTLKNPFIVDQKQRIQEVQSQLEIQFQHHAEFEMI